MLIWHLYQAALAGRDIYYDQRYRHNLEMREMLEEILDARRGRRRDVLAEITRYTKLFWINTGPYNNLTARKFVLKLHARRAPARRRIAPTHGARFPLRAGRVARATLVDALTRRCSSTPTVDPMVTQQDAGRRPRHPRGRARTTCTTA